MKKMCNTFQTSTVSYVFDSFGRLYVNDQSVSEIHRSNHADIARSLITMVAYNIGYLACLVGRIHGVTRFVFAGKFIHNHDVTMMEIRRAVNFYATYYHQNVTFINEQECKIPQRTCAVQPSKSICQKCPKQIWDESKRKVLKDQNTYCSQSQFSNEESVPCSSKSLLLSSPTARVSHDISHTREASDESKALFLTHDGYLGSLGAFLLLHKKKV
ncbi:uncharacterized protein LOC128883149 [Hylaeus volcanicus]|uniref:uncharacterized protein LOC128883149 n=1 Tax=Hylaeus volcanicus TaxID=313075 RepID=UPI0023B7D8B4|nr:uncharacterized protein LOC128883149 [Hylaeus volcanicus]